MRRLLAFLRGFREGLMSEPEPLPDNSFVLESADPDEVHLAELLRQSTIAHQVERGEYVDWMQ